MRHWIIIADASGARVFSMQGLNQPLEMVKELANPNGRLRNQELVTDGSGRFNKSGAPGTQATMSPRTSAHDDAADRFARELAELLRVESARDASTTFSLVAPSHFLGVLRALLSKEVERKLRGTLARDLVHVPVNELPSHLETLLQAGTFA